MRGFWYSAVSGDSMTPTLTDGDWILAVRRAPVAVGDVVIVERPDRPGLLVVKRVARITSSGYWVLGDHPDRSTDSRDFGPVPRTLARVVWRVRPWGRVRAGRDRPSVPWSARPGSGLRVWHRRSVE